MRKVRMDLGDVHVDSFSTSTCSAASAMGPTDRTQCNPASDGALTCGLTDCTCLAGGC